MGRRQKVKHKKSSYVSEIQEREKVKESILKVFRARLNLPNQGGALVVGPSKQDVKDPKRNHKDGTSPSGYSTDTSSDSMSGREKSRKKRSTVKRRKLSNRTKQKSEKINQETASAAVTKHMKVARGVSYSRRTGKDDVPNDDIPSVITHSRITQQVGLVNTGKKSAAVTRVPLQVPEYIRRQTEEEFRKIVDSVDNAAPPIADINEVQRKLLSGGSRGTCSVTPASIEMKPQTISGSTVDSIEATISPQDPKDRFTEVLPIKETLVSLISSLKEVKKQMYPGRDCLSEVTDELLKLMKQNAPRSATPTPIPVFSKILSSGSVQRKLVDQFPPEPDYVGGIDTQDTQKENGIHLKHYSHTELPDHCKPPDTYHFTNGKPFQPINVQNTRTVETEETGMLHNNSLQNYKNSRPAADSNLKLVANVLDKLHKGSEKENQLRRPSIPQAFDQGRNIYNIGIGNLRKDENQKFARRDNSDPGVGAYKNINSDWNVYDTDTHPGIYVLKKQRMPNNLQMLYESAKLLQKQHADPRERTYIRNELLEDDSVKKILASGPEKQSGRDADSYFGFNYKDTDRAKLDSVLGDFVESKPTYIANGVTNLDVSSKKRLGEAEVNAVYEPMEVDDKLMDHDAENILEKNDRKSIVFEYIDGLSNPPCLGEISDRGMPNYIDNLPESHSQGSSQCSRSSCAKSSRYSGSQHGDILSQVVAKEPDYMPSFHGGFYVDRLNAKDLMLEQRKEKEVNVEPDAMDILDYIDSRPEDGLALTHRMLQRDLPPASDKHRILYMDDNMMGYKPMKPLDNHSPDEPKYYPRHMY